MSNLRVGPTRDALNRRGWILWGATFAVLIALTVVVPLVYVPLLRAVAAEGRGHEGASGPYFSLVALSGLVSLFCLYTALKHRELNAMREALAREEREKENVRTRLSELSALFQVSTALNLQLRLDAILEIIVRRVVATLRAQQASVMIYNPETGVLETRATYGLESEYAKNARKRLGEGIAGWVAERLEAVQLDGNDPHQTFGQHMKANRNITSALSLPLRVGERCVGVLNVNRINHPEVFQDHHREMLQLFAEHVGAVIDRAEVMDRMGHRTRQLEADNQKLAETNRLKDVFLSTATHELKTPLTSVIAYAELLDENEKQLDRNQRGEFLRRLRTEAQRLLALIEEILDLSRIESGKLTLHRVPIALNEVARAACETSRAVGRRRGVEIDEVYDTSLPMLPLDEVKMRQVLVNLLTNAIKFSPDNARVAIQTGRDGDHLRIEVRDRGEGIHPEDATHIFELFGQGLHGPARKGGLGIGLHLVKRITELHGGHVGVNSTPGDGSTFWVRLPLALAETGEVTEPAVAEHRAA
ncbi:MAG TPA: GAF domain-containing sensor histidine kinase [Candidatus Eisenbacteria bacterium]